MNTSTMNVSSLRAQSRIPSSVLLVLIMVLLCVRAKGDSKGQDRVHFANGDELTGDFVSATGTSVVFLTKVAGQVTLKWQEISRIAVSPQPILIVQRDKNLSCSANRFIVSEFQVANGEVSWSNGNNTLSRVTPNNLISATSQLAQAPDRKSASCSSGWVGQLGTQNSVVNATQSQYQLGSTLHIARDNGQLEPLSHRVADITAQASFGESSKPGASPIRTVLYEGLFQESMFITQSRDQFSGAYLFGIGDLYHNLSLGMNLQQSYGVGIGWQRVSDKGHVYGLAADARYEHEDIYSPGPSLDVAALGISENYSLPLSFGKTTVTLFERTTFVPSLNVARAFQARGIFGADLPVSKRVSIGLQETDDYLRNAPPKSKQNYSKAQLTMKYTIGPLSAK